MRFVASDDDPVVANFDRSLCNVAFFECEDCLIERWDLFRLFPKWRPV